MNTVGVFSWFPVNFIVSVRQTVSQNVFGVVVDDLQETNESISMVAAASRSFCIIIGLTDCKNNHCKTLM